MSHPRLPDSADLSPSVVQRLDQACDRFEAAWKAGQRPRIEAFLEDVPSGEQPRLLSELVGLEMGHRRQAGEPFTAEEYRARFPSIDLGLLTTAPAPARADTPAARPPEEPPLAPGATRIRCPHCHNPILLADDRPDEVLCPGCGSSFRVREARQTTTAGGMRPLGKFQLLERVGLGAFGAVWRAKDMDLDRIVALKIPHASLLTSEADLERFHREARAAAQLRHPGIVTVHEVQTLEGLPTIVADFIDGVPLRGLLEVRRLTFREAAALVADVAEAVDYAHGMGLVHRDLKPANIMMDYGRPRLATEEKGASVSEGAPGGLGKPLVMDFGLALREEAEVTLTLDGHIIGTPAYMSPEQAAGKGHQADRRSDVYSLGVILYELLTGELPFRGSKMMMLHQVLREEPRAPRKLNDKVPRDLETICLKALAKEPGRRYARAADLAADLRHFLQGEPIQARPVGATERAWRWAKRKPAAAVLVVVSGVAALALVGAAVGLFYSRQLKEANAEVALARDAEAEQKQRAEAALARAESLFYLHRVGRARRELAANNIAQAEELLNGCPAELRRWEWHYLNRQCHTDWLTLRGHTQKVTGVALSPDGGRLVSAAGDPQTPNAAGEVKVWDLRTGEVLFPLVGHAGAVWGVAYAPSGSRLASAGADGTVRVWNAADGREVWTLAGHAGPVQGVAFSPDGRQLASAGADGTVRLWDVAGGTEVRTLTGHTGAVRAVAYHPTGKQLASAGTDGTVRLWDTASGGELHRLRGHAGEVAGVAYSPDGKRLASAGKDKTVKIWDILSGAVQETLTGHASDVTAVAFAPDGVLLAAADGEAAVQVWDTTSPKWLTNEQKELLAFRGHGGRVSSLAFSADGFRLASGSEDRTIKLWQMATSPGGEALPPQRGVAYSLAYSPDSKFLAVGHGGYAPPFGQVKVWDTATKREAFTLGAIDSCIYRLAYSPDGKRLAAAATANAYTYNLKTPGAVTVWEVATRRRLYVLPGHAGAVTCVAYSADGSRLASGSGPWDQASGEVQIWDAATGRELLTLKGHTRRVEGVAFSPDGRRLASADQEGTVNVWDGATGQVLMTLRGERCMAVAFSPDGKRVLVGGWTNTKIWDAETGEELLILPHKALGFSFTPDGQRVATVSRGAGASVWDMTTGEEVAAFHLPHSFGFDSAAFSPDGARLALGDQEGTVTLFEPYARSGGQPTDRAQEEASLRKTWHANRADAEERGGNWFAALFHLNQLLQTDRGDGSLHARQGRAYLELGQTAAALASFEEALSLKATNHAFWFHRARALALAGRPREALVDYTRALELSPDDGPTWLGCYLAHARLGHTAEASKAYRQALELGKRVWLPADKLWQERTRDLVDWSWSPLWQGLAEDCSRLLTADAPGIWLWRARGLAYTRLGDSAGALMDLARVTERQPDDAEAWLVLGRARAELSQWAEAANCWSKVITLKAGGPGVWYLRGLAHAWQNQHARALGDYSQAIAGGFDGWAIRAERSYSHLQLRQWEPAAADATRAYTVAPDRWEGWANAAAAWVNLGEWQKAAACLARELPLRPGDQGVWREHALLALHEGNGEGYRRDCGELLARFVQPNAKFDAGWLVRTCVLSPDAVRDWGQLVRVTEGYTYAIAQPMRSTVRGAALYRAGRWRESVEALDQAVILQAGGGTAFEWLFLAMAHHRLGHLDDARRWLDKAAQVLRKAKLPDAKSPTAETPLPWQDRLELEILYREAQGLVR